MQPCRLQSIDNGARRKALFRNAMKFAIKKGFESIVCLALLILQANLR